MATSQQGSLEALDFREVYPNMTDDDFETLLINFRHINNTKLIRAFNDFKEAQKWIKNNASKDALGRKKTMRITVVDIDKEETVGEIVFATKRRSPVKEKAGGVTVEMSLQAPSD